MSPAATSCSSCGITNEPESLSCPGCGRLTRSSELQALSAEAQKATATGDLTAARKSWQRALALLPEDTVQHRSIQMRIAELDSRIAAMPAQPRPWWKKASSALAPVALLAWKFKALLFGLTKLSTLLSMLAFFGVYWSLYGWPLALGIVLSIYVHEMGHVQAIRGYGFPASAPMFIPGLGAFIRLRTLSITAVQDARIGLAGPLYGLAAAGFCFAVYLVSGARIWGAIAHLGAMINLFNLIPVWQLDGSRGFHSLTKGQRTVVLVWSAVLGFIVHQPVLFLIAAGAAYRLFTKDEAREPDTLCLWQFSGLLAAFTCVMAFTPLR